MEILPLFPAAEELGLLAYAMGPPILSKNTVYYS